MQTAFEMIVSAHTSGADVVKFQLYSECSRSSLYSREHRYSESSVGEENTLAEEFERSRLSYKQASLLIDFCNINSINLLFSVFDLASLEFLLGCGIESVKIASMDANNLVLHNAVLQSGISNIFISTGMSDIDEVQELIKLYRHSGKHVIIMQCSSVYPLSDADVNLNVLSTLARLLPNNNFSLGFSDHTSDTLASTLAVTYGVKYIERHFTTDRSLPGPDNKFSLTPELFSRLRTDINRVPILAGVFEKSLLASEMVTYRSQKKSLFFKKDFASGSILSLDDFILLPPPLGLCPFEFSKLESTQLLKSVFAGAPCLLSDFSK